MKEVYLAAILAAFCFGGAGEVFAEATSPISQGTAAAICANHGGMQPHSPTGTYCTFCSQSVKHCAYVYCEPNGCVIQTSIKGPPPGGDKPVNAAPIKSGKPVQEK
jgi:hypothetical protein